MSYAKLIEKKAHLNDANGFEPIWIPDFLFDFQKYVTDWSIRQGRAAEWLDCVAGETMISTEFGPIRMDKLTGGERVWSMMPKGELGLHLCSRPWVNGFAEMYKVICASGASIVGTKRHKVLTSKGWSTIGDLRDGDSLHVYDVSRLPSILELDLSVHASSDRSSYQRLPGYQDDCSAYSYLCDELPPTAIANGQAAVQQLTDVRGHTRRSFDVDGLGRESSRNHLYQSIGHPSMSHLLCQTSCTAVIEGCPIVSSDYKHIGENNHTFQLIGEGSILPMIVDESLPLEDHKCVYLPFIYDTVTAIQYERTDYFYDMEVPGPANYLANGIVSHNCGMGKTPLGLVWSENVKRYTNKPVLVIAPLGVAPQIVREADKFGIQAQRSRDGQIHSNITVTNIERLDKFNPEDFAGVWLDEASCIKSLNGVRRKQVTGFLRKMPYRLLTSATNAPNDPTEFGTASEALGYMGNQDVLSTFFRTRDDSLHPVWQNAKFLFKAHAELKFYKYLCSFSRTARKPSDMGFENGRFELPPLNTYEHTVVNTKELTGSLFVEPAVTLSEQREENKLTIKERCEKVTELCERHSMSLAWAHTNEEGELLTQMIDGAVEVAGRHDDDYKEEMLLGFASGDIKKLVTKWKIAGWGMNFQKCDHMTSFPSHSWEGYYQAVRRMWRFGQDNPVTVDIITTEGQQRVLENLKRKQELTERMFENLVTHMNDALGMRLPDNHVNDIELPEWL